jgi:PAS domain S-box-containing protein
MRDEDKSKEQLIEELSALRRQVVQLQEASDAETGRPGDGLREDAARLRAILDTTVDGMITIDEDRTVQSFNRAAERIFGYAASEVIGRNVNMLMPSPYRENHDGYVKNYLRTGIAKIIGVGREVKGQRKDGSTFPLYLAVSEVRVGERRLFTGILRDISELKQATEEMRSLARFPDENPFPTLRAARDGTLLYANASSELLLQTWGCEVGGRLPDPWRSIVSESLSSGMNREIEVQCGNTVYSLALTPVLNADDVNIYGRDITERKRAGEALRQSEQKHRVLVQSSSDAILMVDTDRNIISFNRAFLDLFGFRWEEVEGRSTRILHPSEESFLSFSDEAFPAIESTGSFRTEWLLARKDGSIFPVEETMAAVRNPNGSLRGFVAVIRDIAERKSTEEELKAHRERLEEMVTERTRDLETAQKALIQKEKLKTLGAIAAELAHEIRNPLMSIGGFARRLKDKCPRCNEVEIILSESNRLEKILDRIKSYLNPVEMRPQECSVNEIMGECLGLLSSELNNEGVSLDVNLPSGLSFAYADPGILIQVLINIIKSATKVIKKGGVLAINNFETEQNVHIEVRAPIERTITNPEDVYLPFSEDERGISVPLCFKLLMDMRGTLSFRQEEGSAVFSIALPKAFGSLLDIGEAAD